MGGGKSSSSSSQETNNLDNRVVADGSALAIGANTGSNVSYQYTQGLDERAVQLLTQVLETVDNVASGAGRAVDNALATTQTVAERQQVSPTANALADLLKSPFAWLVGGGILLYGYRKAR